MKEVLNEMIAQLSEEDKAIFAKLAEKMQTVDGDISKLSPSELEIIKQMEAKYAEKLRSVHQQSNQQHTSHSTGHLDLLESGFANYVRQLLARDLKEQFPQEEDAVRFAFQNKWIAPDLKDLEVAQQVFEDYKDDISEANQWREEVVGVESDKAMAVGLTWFMVLFQLHQRLNS